MRTILHLAKQNKKHEHDTAGGNIWIYKYI